VVTLIAVGNSTASQKHIVAHVQLLAMFAILAAVLIEGHAHLRMGGGNQRAQFNGLEVIQAFATQTLAHTGRLKIMSQLLRTFFWMLCVKCISQKEATDVDEITLLASASSLRLIVGAQS